MTEAWFASAANARSSVASRLETRTAVADAPHLVAMSCCSLFFKLFALALVTFLLAPHRHPIKFATHTPQVGSVNRSGSSGIPGFSYSRLSTYSIIQRRTSTCVRPWDLRVAKYTIRVLGTEQRISRQKELHKLRAAQCTDDSLVRGVHPTLRPKSDSLTRFVTPPLATEMLAYFP